MGISDVPPAELGESKNSLFCLSFAVEKQFGGETVNWNASQTLLKQSEVTEENKVLNSSILKAR